MTLRNWCSALPQGCAGFARHRLKEIETILPPRRLRDEISVESLFAVGGGGLSFVKTFISKIKFRRKMKTFA